MSFWDKFGKILSVAGPLAAIPFTGGASALGLGGAAGGAAGKILSTVGKIGGAVAPILGQAAGARATAQQSNARDQMTRDEINQHAAAGNNALPGQRLGTAARASLANAGPVKFSGLPGAGFGQSGGAPSFTGGFNEPLDPRVKQLSSSVMDQELQNQLTGGDKIPGATPAPKSGMVDKLLSGGAFGASLFSGLDSTGMFDHHSPVNDSHPAQVGPSDPMSWDYYNQMKRQNPSILATAGGLQ